MIGFLARGPYIPHPHSSGGFLGSFLHAVVWSLGWHAGADLAPMIGSKLLIVVLLCGLVWWLVRGRSIRRR